MPVRVLEPCLGGADGLEAEGGAALGINYSV